MAIEKVKPRVGALKEAMKNKDLTQERLREICGCSRTTIADINKGKEVKFDTMNEIAKALRIPIEHLIEQKNDANEENLSDEFVVADYDWFRRVSIKLQRIITANDLKQAIGHSKNIRWALQIEDMDEELSASLVNFEQKVTEFKEYEQNSVSFEGNSLAKLVDKRKSHLQIQNDIALLVEKNVFIYGTNYLEWRQSESYEYSDPYGEGPSHKVVDYVSERNALIIINNQNKISTRHELLLDPPPPQQRKEDDPIIRVDGRELKEQREQSEIDALDADNDFPF